LVPPSIEQCTGAAASAVGNLSVMKSGCSIHPFKRSTIMQNETGNPTGGDNDTALLEAEMCNAAAHPQGKGA
jgi:hypothetical protein